MRATTFERKIAEWKYFVYIAHVIIQLFKISCIVWTNKLRQLSWLSISPGVCNIHISLADHSLGEVSYPCIPWTYFFWDLGNPFDRPSSELSKISSNFVKRRKSKHVSNKRAPRGTTWVFWSMYEELSVRARGCRRSSTQGLHTFPCVNRQLLIYRLESPGTAALAHTFACLIVSIHRTHF